MKIQLAIFGITMAIAGCGEDEGTVAESLQFDDAQVIAGYVDNVMVPKYGLLATRADELQAAVEAFVAEPTDANLSAAQDVWRATRRPWEQSETSLFGPVDVNGYDPSLDSWPINLTDLNGVLASETELTQSYFDGLDASVKGFHTAEMFLFGEDGDQTANGLSDREKTYLKLCAADIARVANLLADSWTTGASPYGEVFKTAGEAGNSSYPSRAAAAQEIVSGMAGILDEVANGKIADPYSAKDQSLVESPFSFNSIRDFSDNVRGAKTAYLGDFELAQRNGPGLNDWVETRDPELNARIIAEFDTAISAIEAIPEPFREAILDDAGRAKIQVAIDAINSVKSSVESDLQPLVQGQ